MMVMPIRGWRTLQEWEVVDLFIALMVSNDFMVHSLVVLLVFLRVLLYSLGWLLTPLLYWCYRCTT